MPYSTRESCGFLWQRVHLDGYSRSFDASFHLDISAAAIKERLEGIDVAVLLDYGAVEGYRRYFQFSRHLREHDILAPRHAAVVASVDNFVVERLLR